MIKKVKSKKPVDLKTRPVDSMEELWGKLYPLIEHWQSDMKFFKDEVTFLHLLIDKYFIALIKEKNIAKTRTLARKLFALEPRRKMLDQRLTTHLLHLQELIENPFSHDAHVFNAEHASLEKEMAGFIKDFRILKKEAFQTIEAVIVEEARKRIL